MSTNENITHDDLVLLTAYMAEHHYPASEVAYAVEKPWKYVEELEEAQAERDEEGSREILPLERQYPKLPDVERHPTLKGFY